MRDTAAVMRPWAEQPDAVAVSNAVQAARQASRHRVYWANASAQIFLHRYFQRIDIPDAEALLDRVLGIARGPNAMYERQSREIANVILGALTHPLCAAIPTTDFPAIAIALRPTAEQVIDLPLDARESVTAALTQALADGYARSAIDFEDVMARALQAEVADHGPTQ